MKTAIMLHSSPLQQQLSQPEMIRDWPVRHSLVLCCTGTCHQYSLLLHMVSCIPHRWLWGWMCSPVAWSHAPIHASRLEVPSLPCWGCERGHSSASFGWGSWVDTCWYLIPSGSPPVRFMHWRAQKHHLNGEEMQEGCDLQGSAGQGARKGGGQEIPVDTVMLLVEY